MVRHEELGKLAVDLLRRKPTLGVKEPDFWTTYPTKSPFFEQLFPGQVMGMFQTLLRKARDKACWREGPRVGRKNVTRT